MTVSIEIGVGELIDRYTILRIKLDEIKDSKKLKNIQKEYDYVAGLLSKLEDKEGIQELVEDLFVINESLWDIENELRHLEKIASFEDEFIQAARSVYRLNDKRAEIKKTINLLYGSGFIEEKSYE